MAQNKGAVLMFYSKNWDILLGNGTNLPRPQLRMHMPQLSRYAHIKHLLLSTLLVVGSVTFGVGTTVTVILWPITIGLFEFSLVIMPGAVFLLATVSFLTLQLTRPDPNVVGSVNLRLDRWTKRIGMEYWFWFVAHTSAWLIASAIVALGLLDVFAAQRWTIAVMTGCFAVAGCFGVGLVASIAGLSAQRRRMLGICWRSQFSNGIRNPASRVLETVFLVARLSGSELRNLKLVGHLAAVLERKTGLSVDLAPLFREALRRESLNRAMVFSLVFLVAAIVAYLASFNSLFAPTDTPSEPPSWVRLISGGFSSYDFGLDAMAPTIDIVYDVEKQTGSAGQNDVGSDATSTVAERGCCEQASGDIDTGTAGDGNKNTGQGDTNTARGSETVGGAGRNNSSGTSSIDEDGLSKGAQPSDSIFSDPRSGGPETQGARSSGGNGDATPDGGSGAQSNDIGNADSAGGENDSEGVSPSFGQSQEVGVLDDGLAEKPQSNQPQSSDAGQTGQSDGRSGQSQGSQSGDQSGSQDSGSEQGPSPDGNSSDGGSSDSRFDEGIGGSGDSQSNPPTAFTQRPSAFNSPDPDAPVVIVDLDGERSGVGREIPRGSSLESPVPVITGFMSPQTLAETEDFEANPPNQNQQRLPNWIASLINPH